MRRNTDKTTTLPKRLKDEISAEDGRKVGRTSNIEKGKRIPTQRKEQRKAERELKKAQRRRPWLIKGSKPEGNGAGSTWNQAKQNAGKVAKTDARLVPHTGPKIVKPKAKKSKEVEVSKEHAALVSTTAKSSYAAGSSSRLAVKESAALAEDDAEIAALEKKLGVRRKKKPAEGDGDDVLDDILGSLGGHDDDDANGRPKKRRRAEDDEWLRSKRRKAEGIDESDEEHGTEDESADDHFSTGDDSAFDDGAFGEDITDSEEAFGAPETHRASGDGSEDAPPSTKKARENPYLPPKVTSAEGASTQYIPPPLRASLASESDDLHRLRRQGQGLLNRLSESNFLSIVSQFEQLYRRHPRQHVTTTVAELLIGLVCDRSTLSDTFLMLHAGFVAALYKTVGVDFGAYFLKSLAENLDDAYDPLPKTHDGPASNESGRKSINLMSLLSELYNLQVVNTQLMFDYLRLFLSDVSEINTELVLKIMRNSGPMLRQHDPSALKDIVLLLRQKIAQVGEDKLTARAKFMVETINDLKNNKVKAPAAGSSVRSEALAQMKRLLGSLRAKRSQANEPLSVSLQTIRNADKKGMWWLGGPMRAEAGHEEENDRASDDGEVIEDPSGASALLKLARDQHMNTDVRRDIFVAIMSATDCRDAHMRLTKLRLKRAQEKEIPRVLVHCAGGEQVYNPYYTVIARRLCTDRRLRKNFQFSLWSLFRALGEGEDSEDEDDETDDDEGLDDDGNKPSGIGMRKMVNLAKMFGSLIVEGALDLGILKTLNFAYLRPKTKTFAELLFITVLRLSKEKEKQPQQPRPEEQPEQRDGGSILRIFGHCQGNPSLARGIHYFLKNVVSVTDVAGGKPEKKIVKLGCKAAEAALMEVIAADAGAA